ncbi:MAG: TraB/VirB10 family protein [Limnohabitans sp.]|jgi:conjugal transfer pilus assembly protein TraB|uniref:TraB/VirB10 family protein n=1 Tax=Limnohabitans sp. TaxID=1907725 RepID=UPI00391BF80F
MSDSQHKSLTEKYRDLSAGARTAIVGGGMVIVLFTLGTIFTENPSAPGPRNAAAQRETVTVFNPGNTNATEAVAANLEDARKRIGEQQAKIALLEESIKQAQVKTGDGQWSEIGNLAAQLQALQERVNGMGAAEPLPDSGMKGRNLPVGPQRLTSATSSTGADVHLSAPLPDSQTQVAAAVATTGPTIQVVGGEKKPNKAAGAKKDSPVAYVPSGSNFEAVLMNGMDASTSIGANRNPTPALLRVKTDAILPSLFSFNVRECFVLVGGFGNMSSERVEMRTETMSCIAENGEVFEGKIEGYLVGEDGKAGARGRVVSKQGALLAKSFMAGFVGGLGGAFTPQPVQSLNLNPGSIQTYQFPDAERVLGSGIGRGLNQSGQALANFYIRLAEQMFPVVELDAGRKMTIILLKGVELRMDKKDKS